MHWLVLPALIYFPVFYQLGADAIGMWDESLYAMRAFYLNEHGTFLSNFSSFDPTIDHPNTKPPLITILQALSFRLFGYSELALRLPVSLFVLGTLILMVRWLQKNCNSAAGGMVSVLILITSAGYITNHVSRTGDHDAVLAFWVLLITLQVYTIARADKIKPTSVYLIALLLAAAVLTKGVAAFFILPFIFLWLIYKKKLIPIIRSVHFYIAALTFVFLSSSYYLYFELTNPGFLNTLWFQEIGGRYTGQNHGHEHAWYFYFQLIIQTDFQPWVFAFPLLLIRKVRLGLKNYGDLPYYLPLAGISILLVLSASSTKCEWYDAPVFPLFAMSAGIILSAFVSLLLNRLKLINHRNVSVIHVVLIGLIFFFPYKKTIERIDFPAKDWREEQYGEWLRKLPPGKTISILADRQPNYCVMYYVAAYNTGNNLKLLLKHSGDKIKLNELIICSDASEKFSEHFQYKELDRYKQLELIQIESRIQN